MQELTGRLTALDPEASEGVKVISYFDALIEGHASYEILLRGAAILSGCAAGFTSTDQLLGVDEVGTRLKSPILPPEGEWPERTIFGEGRTWIERAGLAHANDEIILERLALALSIALERTSLTRNTQKPVETLIDGDLPRDLRLSAAAQLKLNQDGKYTMIAEPGLKHSALGHHALVVTQAGIVRATIRNLNDEFDSKGRAGIGAPAPPELLWQSWSSALAALRMTSTTERICDAAELGGITLLAEVATTDLARHPDVRALKMVVEKDPQTIGFLESISSTESVRASAAQLGLHHSTVQSRVTALSEVLGFPLTSSYGKSRLDIALKLLRLLTNRFD